MADVRRLKAVIEYDGTDFAGWQSQINGRAVQDVLETALRELLQEEIRVTGAGRTDAGVHARGQVAHFDTRGTLSSVVVRRGLNALLPKDVSIRSVEEVATDFHARFSASSRSYSYAIHRGRSPLYRRVSWSIYSRLDDAAAREAAGMLVGTRDFTPFSKRSEDAEHGFCHVFEAVWRGEGEFSRFFIRANRFLYGMVRMIVGALAEVGRGKTSPEEFGAYLERGERGSRFMLAPAQGLVFESVSYDREEFQEVKRIMEQVRGGSAGRAHL